MADLRDPTLIRRLRNAERALWVLVVLWFVASLHAIIVGDANLFASHGALAVVFGVVLLALRVAQFVVEVEPETEAVDQLLQGSAATLGVVKQVYGAALDPRSHREELRQRLLATLDETTKSLHEQLEARKESHSVRKRLTALLGRRVQRLQLVADLGLICLGTLQQAYGAYLPALLWPNG